MAPKQPQNLYFIGFMGTGKSAISTHLSRHIGRPVVEMDEELARLEGLSIPQIFAEKGETYFRDQETQLLHNLSQKSNLIVSCGGGVVLRPENIATMQRSGIILLLEASPETILERVSRNNQRPLLQGRKTVADIQAMLDARQPYYDQAATGRISVDGKTIHQICQEIQARWL